MVNSATLALFPDKTTCGGASVRMVPGTGMALPDAGISPQWPGWRGAGGKSFAGVTTLNWLPLRAVTSIAYSARSDLGGLAIYANLFVDIDGDGAFDPSKDDILVYDPVETGKPVVHGLWTDWDAMAQPGSPGNPGWRCHLGNAKKGQAGTKCSTTDRVYFSDLAAGNPRATVIPAPCGEAPFPSADQNDCATQDAEAPGLLFVVGQKSGENWGTFSGALDGVQVGVQGFGTKTYRFSPDAQ